MLSKREKSLSEEIQKMPLKVSGVHTKKFSRKRIEKTAEKIFA
jgi:hypothetical protein